MSDVMVESGAVTRIAINRPSKKNALTVAATQELARAVRDASSARVIVLTGEGDAFCAGGDFDELQRLASMTETESADQLYGGFQTMIRAVRETDAVVIAMVNGAARGAGMDLALACDLRVMSTTATMGQVWVRLGLVAGTGGAFWATLHAGAARAAQMILSGEVIDAATALQWGLVNELADPSALESRVADIAARLATLPPEALAANKRALNEVIRESYEAALDHARLAQAARFASAEFKASLEAASSSSRGGQDGR